MNDRANQHPRDGTPDRPSNGTEGDGFTESLCAHCKNDRDFRFDGNNGCQILARTLAFNVKDHGYPKEWIWKGGEPTCTAFDDERAQITNEERAAQVPLL